MKTIKKLLIGLTVLAVSVMDARAASVISGNHENLIRVESKSTEESGYYLFQAKGKRLDEYQTIRVVGLEDLDVLELPIGMVSLDTLEIRRCRIREIRLAVDTSIKTIINGLDHSGSGGAYIRIETPYYEGIKPPPVTIYAPIWMHDKISCRAGSELYDCDIKKDADGEFVVGEFSGHYFAQYVWQIYWMADEINEWRYMNLFEFITKRDRPGFTMFFKTFNYPVQHRKNGSVKPCMIELSLPDLAVNPELQDREQIPAPLPTATIKRGIWP